MQRIGDSDRKKNMDERGLVSRLPSDTTDHSGSLRNFAALVTFPVL